LLGDQCTCLSYCAGLLLDVSPWCLEPHLACRATQYYLIKESLICHFGRLAFAVRFTYSWIPKGLYFYLQRGGQNMSLSSFWIWGFLRILKALES
jgi:hypothetical protein